MKVKELVVNKLYRASTWYGVKVIAFSGIVVSDIDPYSNRLCFIELNTNEKWYYAQVDDINVPVEELSSLEFELW